MTPGIELLFHMPRDVFRHLEHGHLLFASKNSFERIVSVDQRFVLPDVIPKLLGYFGNSSGWGDRLA